MSLSGIYKLECECGTQYVGKTSRKFKQRFHEHKYSFIYNKPEKSNFAAHLLNNHHPLNNECFHILKIINSNSHINTWEEFEIYNSYCTGHNINDQLPIINNLLFKTLMNINNKYPVSYILCSTYYELNKHIYMS